MKYAQTLVGACALLASHVEGQSTQPISNSSYGYNAPSVDLGYVKYQGYTNATIGINYFRGIQYVAANPSRQSGNLAWYLT